MCIRSVHWKMLSIHVVFGLPLLRDPGVVPCIICFSKLSELQWKSPPPLCVLFTLLIRFAQISGLTPVPVGAAVHLLHFAPSPVATLMFMSLRVWTWIADVIKRDTVCFCCLQVRCQLASERFLRVQFPTPESHS